MSNLDDLANAIVNKFLPKPSTATEGDQLVYTGGKWKSGKASGESNIALGIAAAPSGGDDTAAIKEACTKRLTLRPGTYYYNGDPMDVVDPWLVGQGPTATLVVVKAGGYVFDCNQLQGAVMIRGIRFEGGAGVYRNRYTGSNVIREYVIQDCYFHDQTGTVISHNAGDMPYWHIERNVFNLKDEASTMCIALSGLTDQSSISQNKFLHYGIGVKLGQNFANIIIANNDFIHFGAYAGTPRVNIWMVPKVSPDAAQPWNGNVIAGVGTVIRDNKFGPELQNAADYRILIAPEGAGALFGDRKPSYTKSSGYVNGITVCANEFGGTVDGIAPVVVSWTPNVVSSVLGPNHFSGYMPDTFLRFDGDLPTGLAETQIGPVYRQWAGDASSSMKATNADPALFWIETRSSKPNELFPLSPA